MNLKSGCLFWPGVMVRPDKYGRLEQDASCEVAVVGAGITGALVAFHLVEAGVDVVVIDRRDPACGSSAASTGLLQYEIDTLLGDLSNLIGPSSARRAYELSLQTLSQFESLIPRLDDACGFAVRPSLYLGVESKDVETLTRERDQRQKIGIDVELLSEPEIRRTFGFSRPAALYSRRAAEVDPYRLTLALHRAAVARGARVFGQTEIVRYEPHDNGVTMRTASGLRISTRNVVFATGYETPEFVDRKLCRLKSTYALASEPLGMEPLWHEQCLIWEHRRPYFYARGTSDGWVLVGGADIDTADSRLRDSLINEKAEQLAKSFRAMFPHLSIDAGCAWAGTFAETKDGLPYIGTLPEFPHGYFALGYGGNGITFSLLAAQIIRDQILGRGNDDAALFRFGR